MSEFVHTSTKRGPIRVREDMLAVDCTVHLFNPSNGTEQEIEFEVEQEVGETAFDSLLEKISSGGRTLAKAFIDAHAARGGKA